MRFRDRVEAGRLLAESLAGREPGRNVVVLGLPRGGVPVAAEVARALGAPLDVLIVRKLGVPWQPELGFGALASGGIVVLNWDIVRALNLRERDLEAVIERERAEVERREKAYRGDRPLLELEGKTVILVDDGLATGGTMQAAVHAVRQHKPARVVVAVPVAPERTMRTLAQDADEVVCLLAPFDFFAIGQFYRDFRQVADDEVRALLKAAEPAPTPGGGAQEQVSGTPRAVPRPPASGRSGPPAGGSRS